MHLLGLLHVLIAISLMVHAHRTGRPQYWFYILMMVPLAGSIAYAAMEILPEVARTRRARKIVGDLRTAVDPDHSWRARLAEAERVDSIETKRALAEECARRGMWEDAVRLYRAAASGVFADDPELLVGLAEAELGAGRPEEAEAVLDRLRQAHPRLQSPSGHLVYARALEAQNRLDEAEQEFAALSGYFTGPEARVRHGLLLQRMGRIAEAKAAFMRAIEAADASRVPLTEDEREWRRVAQRNLTV
jgi:hypothetical protein